MSRIRGVSEAASVSLITAWCPIHKGNVQVASQVFAEYTRRYGCGMCREGLSAIEDELNRDAEEHGAFGGGKGVVRVDLPDGPRDLEVDFYPGADVKVGDILTLELEGHTMARAAKSEPVIQPDLPGTEEGLPKIPRKLKNKLIPLVEAITEAGNAKLRENELKEECKELMLAAELSEVALPNGGKLILHEGEATIRYQAPAKKKQKVDGEAQEGDGESEE